MLVIRYLQQKSPAKSEAKLKAGLFIIGPENGKLMNNKLFEENLSPLETEA